MTQGVSTSALQNAGMKSVRPVQDSGKKMALRQGQYDDRRDPINGG
ncbi:hypothetical protein QNH14_04545 [Apirhabdus apintestini]|nr:hypothetical protein QNH14_04545 [Enterobacteriaceae bacterium CA-0114]